MKEPNQVTVLDLSNKGITELDLDILMFDELEELILDNNPELRELPEELEYISKLHIISIKNCAGTLLSHLKAIPNLTALNCSNINLDNNDIQFIYSLSSLQELTMNQCNIRFLTGCISNLTQLIRLYLDENKLVTIPEDVKFLDKLEFLSMKNNQLETLPQCLFTLPCLKEIYIDGNVLKQVNSYFNKKRKEDPSFLTDYIIKQEKDKKPSVMLLDEVIDKLLSLGVPVNTSVAIQDKYIAAEEEVWGTDELHIPASIVQLLWGYNWDSVILEWNEEELYDYYDEDEDVDEKDLVLSISEGYYMTDSDAPYFCIGMCNIAGHPHRLSILLDDQNMSNPELYKDDYESEPSSYGTLSEFLDTIHIRK